jgi:hypothetical protein
LDAKAAPIRVLHLTGRCCHDYDKQKRILQAGMEARANVEFTVVHESGKGSVHQYGLLKENAVFAGTTFVADSAPVPDGSANHPYPIGWRPMVGSSRRR